MASQVKSGRKANVLARTRRTIRNSPPDPAVTTALLFSTALGWMALGWRGDELGWLTFGHAQPRDAMTALETLVRQDGAALHASDRRPSPVQLRAQRKLERFARTGTEDFSEIPLFDHGTTPFQRRVLQLCRRLASGEKCSYAELAAAAGCVGGARAVGNVMRTNRVPLVIPCHRVVGAHGKLGGYSAPQGLAMKERLLNMERGALKATKAT